MSARSSGPNFQGPALLFCPGDRPERFEKAVAAADSVILDLEDAVLQDRKDLARENVIDFLERTCVRNVIVRVNPPGTPWHFDDLNALAGYDDVTIMLPKCQVRADVEALAPRPVIALCETAAGILEAASVASAENCVGLMWGIEDLLTDLGGSSRRKADGSYEPTLETAATIALYAARAAGVVPIDTVCVDVEDTVALSTDARAAAGHGFSAKACIHPRQVEVIRAAFRPSAKEIEWATAVLEQARSATGAFLFDGMMIDGPVLAQARRILFRSTA